ncbi:hypothetical protein [Rhizobium sp. BK251]|uniref:hypothetical protein n=1 Tax=Rhizobium sp. BK251 TaxID=2512125 RepID=UPI0010E49184|nr:hypothetical protein [Rhizobium sp. BK251]TCL62035.1 hypothetical protein EV286_1271 [Rhizobium sp. BK251]
MAEDKKIVEVKVTSEGGDQVAVGLMNTEQALSLPEQMDVTVSHPDHAPGATDEFIGRDELRALTEPWVERPTIRFPAPTTDDKAVRCDEAKVAANFALEEIIAAANEAGWARQEVTNALVEAAQFLKDAAIADPDPADDSAVGGNRHR